jgi:hypothetical protein
MTDLSPELRALYDAALAKAEERGIPDGDDEDAAPEPLTLLDVASLDSPTPEIADHARARTSDPWTSHAAAGSIPEEKLRETQAAVLAAFRVLGPMTHEDLVSGYGREAPGLGWPRQSVSGLRTRTSELVAAEFLRNSGRTVRLPSGRHSIVWEAA